METNRDDFVIAIRSAFLRKGAKQKFSLFVLILISAALLSLEFFHIKPLNTFRALTKDFIYRSSFIINLPFQSISKSIEEVQNHFEMYREYGTLKKTIKNTSAIENEIKFYKAENRELKKIIEEESNLIDEILVSKVLIDKKSPFLKSIIINKGFNFGIEKGMAVLDGFYMIGRITEVNYLSSRALLISDLNSKIPVMIEPSGAKAIMSGTGKNYAILDFLPKNQKLENDNIVYTSGSDGIFSAGIPIGKIKLFEKKYRVEFFSDLSQINFIKVKLKKEKNSNVFN
tara:strand:- start:63 stop:920 length:858 start_codon:yes stop_codon:yes gene_type:complete